MTRQWIGTIDSSSYPTVSAGGPLIFMLRSGKLVFPGTAIPCCGGWTWTGGIDGNGIAQFNNSVSRETCSVSGFFNGGSGTASGTFSVTSTGSFPTTGGGRWSVTRVPGISRVRRR